MIFEGNAFEIYNDVVKYSSPAEELEETSDLKERNWNRFVVIFIRTSRFKNEKYMYFSFLCLLSHAHLRSPLQLTCFPLKKEIAIGV